ncbi:phage portal protein, HK97 family [Sphingomonas sp. YR710]|uniref:phage portal protein n=1 Tax=Sphingomonas sp. YR710 TaxID=1882773 RepID=UPI0008860443|nr:phage portal protein [Sphingomonas sp. YR710]SDC30688.1 phage portal protein, HK97 family [Sphingomonas sp. YR710]
MRGLFASLAAPSAKDARPLDMLPGFLMGPDSKSGVTVTFTTALQVAAVLACVKVVAEGVAQSPCKLMKSMPTGTGANPARDHPLFWKLYRQPFGRQTAFEFWETIVIHIMLAGNAFVYINRVAGRIFELILLEPGKVVVTRHADLSLSYEVRGPDGVGTRTVPAEDIWHLRGPSWNGWMGMETVRLAREAIGLAIALEQSHAGLHKNGAKPGGVYSIEGPLTDPQHAQLTEWLKKFAASDSGTPMILDRGAKWLSQQMTGVDAQHLETRRFQIEEVCRLFRVMPIMVGLSEKTATYASSEQMFLAHVIHTLLPWVTRIEQSVEVSLLTDKEQAEGYFLKFNLSGMMRGDYKSRQEGLQIQRRNGIINADEWRDLEDMNPRADAGGVQYIVESNMAIQDGRDLVPTATPPAK